MIAMIVSVVAGWLRAPWWAPFAVFACTLPIIAWQASKVAENRALLGLAPQSDEAWLIGAMVDLLLYVAAYWAGRGLKRLFAGKSEARS
jgi:hypothetical protein